MPEDRTPEDEEDEDTTRRSGTRRVVLRAGRCVEVSDRPAMETR